MEQVEEIGEINLCCRVCGENNFDEREGFFYCVECGTKQEQMRAVEVQHEDNYNEGTFGVRHTVKKQKNVVDTAPELTSWECYNYILRGMVEDLLSMGAKKELKLTVLQIWAAYLGRLEVAFFNKDQAELPKLGPRFFSVDARTLYNHRIEKLKRNRRKLNTTQNEDEKKAMREWKRSKRKLDESAYSIKSKADADSTINDSCAESLMDSSMADNAMKLNYSTAARRAFRKFMTKNHLKKHQDDTDGKLKCHQMRLKPRDIGFLEYQVTTMNIKQIYTIIGIALNLINDDIQLSDLLRFIAEEHISTRDVLRYLPENIGERGRDLLHEISFNTFHDKYSDKELREYISQFARFIPIKGFQQPDIYSLIVRYITELNLPPEIGTIIERLVNFLPPKFQQRAKPVYFHYEARAMAYIVFVLKLLFGLDGEKEKTISKCASELNDKLLQLEQNREQRPLLFVWDEWVEYIEMRKVIVSQFNCNFCKQFKQYQKREQMIDELIFKERKQNEQEHNIETKSFNFTQIQANIKRIFEGFLQIHDNEYDPREEPIAFQPTLTPAHTYFEQLLMHDANKTHRRLYIPEFMKIDHTQRDILSFTNATNLSQFFNKHDFVLNVEQIGCTENSNYIGIFRSLDEKINKKFFTIDTKITMNKWLKEIGADKENKEYKLIGNLVFKKKLESYGRYYKEKIQLAAEKLRQQKAEETHLKLAESIQQQKEIVEDKILKPELLVAEVLVPSENLVESVSLNFIDVSNDETPEDSNEDSDEPKNDDKSNNSNDNDEKIITFLQSNFDYWTLIGYTATLNEDDKKLLFAKFPPIFGWLLETCAQTIGVDWFVLFEQLLTIEMMYTYGITHLNEFNATPRSVHVHNQKDINALTNSFVRIW